MKQFGKGKTLLQLIDRKQFEGLCEKWQMDKGTRNFSTWEQTCTHIMAYVMRLESLREVEAALFVPRSTFSDANATRASGFFEELCTIVLRQIQSVGGRKVKRALHSMPRSWESCRLPTMAGQESSRKDGSRETPLHLEYRGRVD